MKKGQAAMEFLMTYGWAILVVLVAIGALAYFGVLSPARFLPSSCTLIPGLSCDEFKVDGTAETVTIRMTNGMGEDLSGVILTLVGDSNGACAAANSGTAVDVGDGTTAQFDISCTAPIPAVDRFKSDITITYTSGTLQHDATGSITAQVE